jgi:hypothetical protein
MRAMLGFVTEVGDEVHLWVHIKQKTSRIALKKILMKITFLVLKIALPEEPRSITLVTYL